MRLDDRITKLEKESTEAYCEGHNLDPVKFENEEYGEVMYLVNTIVYPRDKHGA